MVGHGRAREAEIGGDVNRAHAGRPPLSDLRRCSGRLRGDGQPRASAVLGIVFTRAEGPIEVGPAGLKATITQLTSVATSEDLTLEDKGEILATTLAGSGRTIEPDSIPSAEAFGTPKLSEGGAALQPHPSAFEAAAMQQFASEGWEINVRVFTTKGLTSRHAAAPRRSSSRSRRAADWPPLISGES